MALSLQRSASVIEPPTRPTLIFPAASRSNTLLPPPLPLPQPTTPPPRPSERPTLKTLPPVDEAKAGTSNTEIIELSASALDSVPSLLEVEGFTPRPRSSPRGWATRVGGVAAGMVLGVVAVVAGTKIDEAMVGVNDELGPAREPRVLAGSSRELALRPASAAVEAMPPAGQCIASGTARLLASRATLGPGLDVTTNAMGGSFAIGFARTPDEAQGVRLDGAALRVADRLRVRGSAGAVRHVAVDVGRTEDEALDVRIDEGDARTLVPEGPRASSLRFALVDRWVEVVNGGRGRALWPVPGSFGKGRPLLAATATTSLRVAARENGGAVIALRRPSALWVGLVDANGSADGPLVPIARANAVMGMPSVARDGAGGAVAWAERPAGDNDFIVMVASFGGGGATPTLRPIGAGMSPSLAPLAHGELLLTYAVGTPGAHRVVVVRLARDLEPRGEPVFVSPDQVNAGQPAAVVGADGRGLVAFFGAAKGQGASVLATPLACAPSL